MAPDNETQKPSRVGTSQQNRLVVSDEMMADGGNDNNKDDTNNNKSSSSSSQQPPKLHEILKNSLDQAMPKMMLISERVEEIGSKTLASVREWRSTEDNGHHAHNSSSDPPRSSCSSNIHLINSAEEKIVAQIATCCKPTNIDITRSIDDDDDDDDMDTMVTYETADDHHARMIQRLSSWNTLETTMTKDEQQKLLLQPQETTTTTHKKKSVQFDYPPVQAMSEIPRTRTNDLPSLFYSEEELNQLRGDRISTISSEDVEVVAISISPSSSSSLLVGEKDDEDSSSSESSNISVGTSGSKVTDLSTYGQGTSPNKDIISSNPDIISNNNENETNVSPRNVMLLTRTGSPIPE